MLLRGLDVDSVSQYMQNAQSASSVIVQDSAANRVAEFWRSLISGRQSRCHLPPYGLIFHLQNNGFVEASICWQCNNIYGTQNGEPFHYEFDSSTPSSEDLLAYLNQLLPLETTP